MHFKRMSRVFFSLIAICAIGFTGCNQPSGSKPLGKISATIVTGENDSNDKKTMQWNVLNRSQWQGKPPHGSIILLGQLPLDDSTNTAGSVAIRFDYDESSEEQLSAKIRYYVDGLDQPCFASKGGGTASVQLDLPDFNGDTVRLKGTFKAVLPFRLKGKSILDNNRELTDGSFDVVVPVVKDPRFSDVASH